MEINLKLQEVDASTIQSKEIDRMMPIKADFKQEGRHLTPQTTVIVTSVGEWISPELVPILTSTLVDIPLMNARMVWPLC